MSAGDYREEALSRLRQRFAEGVITEEEGDIALFIAGEVLPEVARYLRDELEWDYLSAVTGVDRQDYFEVVYHLYSMARRVGPLVLKVRTDYDAPEVPSVVSLWPGADFQEREVWDLMGIRFTGHPNLKRILLWEGYEGHPLRKDFQETDYPPDP